MSLMVEQQILSESHSGSSSNACNNPLAVLDPARSAVVEACAGSGKTWLLAARIVRLLLAGTPPGEILAITFTRKAAREIEERVIDWLRLLATAPDDQAAEFLAERGVIVDAAMLARARGLYERVSTARPGLAVNTFHGWFLQLIQVAPLSANLAGCQLADDGARRFDELWQTFAQDLQRKPESEITAACLRLFTTIGQNATRELVSNGMARRAEWLAFSADVTGEGAEKLPQIIEQLRAHLGVGEPGEVLGKFFADGWHLDYHAYLGFLEKSELATDSKYAGCLNAALSSDAGEVVFRAIEGVLLTDTGTLRSRKPSKTLDKRFGADGAQRFLALHGQLGESVIATRQGLQEEANFSFNRDALTLHQGFLEHLENFKADRRQIDFVDAEWRVLQLLSDDDSAAYLQARLDARYRHVLLDEFQDTNPLQWRILLAWLDAYTDAQRPTVFLVGDPKQSIYRFRRAEPRLFATASEFLQTRFGALYQARDVTHRNAQAVIDIVNALFATEPTFHPFREQSSFAHTLTGRVELLPLCVAPDDVKSGVDEKAEESSALRDPLRTPVPELIDQRRQTEAAQLAERLQVMLGKTLIVDRQGLREIERPLRCDDILLLVRTRAQIAVYERALAAAGIPYDAASRGGLLDTLEVRDIVALLEFLVSPAADLSLAHALKSPLFACSDEDLLRLATRQETGWWPRLQAEVRDNTDATDEQPNVAPTLRRAACLIKSWIAAAVALPAHDLLDRIYHEGEVAARYRLSVPEDRCAAVLANLEALLLLALDTSGGRYPSLPRFIDELKSLRRTGDGDAPDEGEVGAEENLAVNGRVRILTIHGAKGLEAPLVWLLDANGKTRVDGPWDVVVDWPPENDAPTHFSFVGHKDNRGVARNSLFEAESAAAAREEFNLLYVAITRAKQLFIASGIGSKKASETSPYGRLQAALEKLGDPYVYGSELPVVGKIASPSEIQATKKELELAEIIPEIGERRMPLDAAASFGVLLHALIERRTEGRANEDGWWRAMGHGDAELALVSPVAERLLSAPALQVFFDPAQYRRAWNELTLTDGHGSVLRLDRLVETNDAWWVLDYKSSSPQTDRLDEYHAQVSAYCQAVTEIFTDKPVRGALIFSDASLHEVF